MRSLLRLLRANIRHIKGGFAGIIVLMTIITFSYSVTVSNNDNLRKVYESEFDRIGYGDAVMLLPDEFSDELADVMKHNEDITGWKAVPQLATGKSIIADGREYSDTIDMLIFSSSEYSVFNEDFSGFVSGDTDLAPGEVYVPYKLKNSDQFGVGSKIVIRTGDESSAEFTVKGYFQDPVNGTALGNTVFMMNASDFEMLKEYQSGIYDNVRYIYSVDYLHIYIKDGADPIQVRKDLCSADKRFDEYIGFITRYESIETNMIYSSIGTRILVVFVVMLLVIILIVMGSSISTAIETEYVNLGILKSQGFGKWHLRAVWLLQYALALIAGSVIGLLISVPASSYLGRMFTLLSGVIAEVKLSVVTCSLYALGIILMCMLFVLFSTRKIGKISPVRAISGGKSEVWFDSRLNMKISKKALGFTIAVRQFTSRWKRYISSILIVGLLVFFMGTVMLLGSGMNSDLWKMPSGDVEVRMSDEFRKDDAEKLKEICSSIDEESRTTLWTSRFMYVCDERYIVQIFDSPKDFDEPIEGRLPEYSNEAMITEIVANTLGKKIGDTITIKNNDSEADYIITGYFQNVMNYGGIAEITYEGGERIGVYYPDIAYIHLSDTSVKKKLADTINEKFPELMSAQALETSDFIENITDTVDTIFNLITTAVYFISLLFSAVVVTMICTKTFQMERTDIGIFKALGFSVQKLRSQFALRFMVIAAAGSVVGAAGEVLLSAKLLTSLMKIIGITRFSGDFTPAMIFLPGIAVSCAFFLFAFISSRRVKSVSVRELIIE